MANKKKSKSKDTNETILTMSDGTTHKVISSEGRYYKCESTQFRKANPNILSVEKACFVEPENELTKEEE